MRVCSRSLLLLALIAALLVAPAAPPAAAWPTSSVEIRGRGWGHGRGLGQWGSFGYAVDHGWTYDRILDHYYGGTTKGSQPDATISVKLVEHDSTTSEPKPMTVTSGAGFTVGDKTFAPNTYARVRWNGDGFDIEQGASCSGPFTPVETVGRDARPEARTTYAGDDVAQMLNLCGTNTRAYRGTLMFRVVDTTFLRVINHVAMEQYLRGVVPRESPASWGDAAGGRGMHALRAQSVAARSYAWAESRNAAFKTCDTIACQVYGGAGLNGKRIEDPRTDQAIADTAGEVRRHADGRIARTEFSSSTGGHTAGGTFPAVPDAGDAIAANPHRAWTVDIPVATVEAKYPTTGTLQKLEVVARNGLGPDGGRATRVRITGTDGVAEVTGDLFRSALGLKSDWFRIIDPSLNAPAVGAAASGTGLVITSTAGEALAHHGAQTFGSMEGIPLVRPVVAAAATPTGKGYWFGASDGGVFAFGDAEHLGSMGGKPLNKPIVGMAATKTGDGYYLVASDGGIFTFGDAAFRGSTGAMRLNKPIVGMALTATGRGYYLVASDGGIFTFGDAPFRGSTGNLRLVQPIVGMAVDPTGRGYWHVAADGGVFTFPSTRPFLGSAGNRVLPAPVVGMVATRSGDGYWLVGRDGALYPFGDATR